MGITRRGSRWLGYFVLLAGLGLSALIEFSSLIAFVLAGLWLVAGLVFVLAGFETPLTERFGWHRFFGLGFSMAGLIQLMTGLFFRTGDGGMFYAVATLSMAVLFAFMGFDIARDGPHFDIDPDETV
ncbi:hypothetical protein [Halococcus thailandensis]|uniref:Uncharacterized protein n=1 Tax=Halococcus thailandensis JCM 13552 TaxID=1227457 RepID=M0N578_9EURY|nr:hypothetical protein [Halococcus thailandensis]EMA53062.1 hypothetical protein C451_10215 [Halococcus thailandensis JCM 13552]